MRSFILSDVQQYSWGKAIATTELELPFIQNQRGLAFMNTFLAGSLGAFFGGVHWFTAIRRRSDLVTAS